MVSLIAQNSAFSELCDDYQLVINEIGPNGDELAGETPLGETNAVFTELVRLRGELATEIERWLQGVE